MGEQPGCTPGLQPQPPWTARGRSGCAEMWGYSPWCGPPKHYRSPTPFLKVLARLRRQKRCQGAADPRQHRIIELNDKTTVGLEVTDAFGIPVSGHVSVAVFRKRGRKGKSRRSAATCQSPGWEKTRSGFSGLRVAWRSAGEGRISGLKWETICRVWVQEGGAAFGSYVPAAVPTTCMKISLMGQQWVFLSTPGSVPAEPENGPGYLLCFSACFRTGLQASPSRQTLLSSRGVSGTAGSGAEGGLC